MKFKTKLAYTSIVLAALAACGGGGGGSTDSTVTPTPTPTPAPATNGGNLATSVPTPTYAAGSVELSMFIQLNDVRLKGGFGMLAQNSALDRSAQNHGKYLVQNLYTNGLWDAATMSSIDARNGWVTAHTERPHLMGFTGSLPVDRAVSSGYAAVYVGEVVSTRYVVQGDIYAGCLDTLLTSVFHRGALLNTQLRDIGMSVSYSANGQALACVIDPAYLAANIGSNPSGWVGIYPAPGQSQVTTAMFGEIPDPVPSAPIKGNPISVFTGTGTTLNVESFTLTDSSGIGVPTKLLTKADFPTYITSNQAYLVPTQALKAATVYTVQFSGTNAGAPLSRSWSFTTK